MTERELLEAINRKLGAMDSRMEAMDGRIGAMDSRINFVGNQLRQLVRHVEEMHQANVRLEAGMQEIGLEIPTPETEIGTRTDFLASKIDHLIEHFSTEQAREQTRVEGKRYLLSHAQAKAEERLDAIARRLDRLEASSS